MCRPLATMPTNWSYMSITRPCSTSLPCGDSGLVKLGWSFSGPDVIASAFTPIFQQTGHLAGLQQHADRTGQRGLAGEDARSRHGDHVAGRRRSAAHHRDHRLLRGNVGDRVVQSLAAGDAAARAVDRHDQRLHVGVVGQLVDRLVELAVVGDDPADREASDSANGRNRRARRAAPPAPRPAPQAPRNCARRSAGASAAAGRAAGRFRDTVGGDQ